MKINKILLILNIPPPFGGGEIRAKILYDYFVNKSQFHIITNSNRRHSKASQGKLTLKNSFNNLKYQLHNSFLIFKIRPKVVYLSIPKGIIQLLKIIPVIISCKIVRAKLVGELAGSQFYFLDKNFVVRKTGKIILRQFYQIRLLGNSVKENLKFDGITNTIVFDNGTDVPKFINNNPKVLNKNYIQLCFIGALHRNKGIYLLAEIAKLLAMKNVLFQLNILGEWENSVDKNAIEKYISFYKLESKVIFHGILHGDAKWKILKNTDLYLFPSYNEGQPISIIEAMAFGIPVIASNVGAIPDTIKNNENGFIIEEQNAKLYADKIIFLAENPNQFNEISSQNLKCYKERFTVVRYCETVERWLNNL